MPGNEGADKIHNFFEQDNLSQEQHNSQISRPEFSRGHFRNQELSLNGSMHGHQGFQAVQNQVEFLGEDVASNRLKVAPRAVPIVERRQGNAPEHNPALGRSSERLETAEAPINFDFLGRQQQLMRNQQSGMQQSQPRQQYGFSDVPAWQQQLMFTQLQQLQKQRQLQRLDQEARQQNAMSQLPSIPKQETGDQLPVLVSSTPVHDTSNYMWPNEHMGGASKVPNSSQMFMMGNMNWPQRGGSSAVQGVPNGVLLSNEQSQMLRSMGVIPQQLDQSLYGAPVASARGAFNQYSHAQGMSQDSADMLARTSGSRSEKPLMQSSSLNKSFHGDQSALFSEQVSMQDGASVSKQEIQGRNFFGHLPFQGVNSGVQPGSYQQLNSVPRTTSMQEFQGGQQQGGWPGNQQEKPLNQMGSSQGFVSLDPGEEKILFSSDDNMWDAASDRSGIIGAGGYGNPLDSTEHLNLFPSMQSGTWSALMQSAVAEASSSDTGLQDEWSGLSYQKAELSTGNQAAILSDSTKQQADWADSNLQNASSSTSRPFPLFDDTKMNQSGEKSSYQQSETMPHNTSYDSMRQSSKESTRWLDRSPPQRMSLVEGNHHVQPSVHLENTSQSAWSKRMSEQSQSAAYPTNIASNDQNTQQGSWVHQQGVPSYNVDNRTCGKPASWNNNESPSPGGDTSLKINEGESNSQHSQRNDLKMAMHMENDPDVGMWKADDNRVVNPFSSFPVQTGSHANRDATHTNRVAVTPNSNNTKAIPEVNQQVQNSHQLDYGQHMVGSSGKLQGDESAGKYHHQLSSQVPESSTYNSHRATDETYEVKRDNSFGKEFYSDSGNSNHSKPTAAGGLSRDNSWLSASDSRLATGNQKPVGQVGRKVSAPPRFQYHPMGNLEADGDPTDTSRRVTHSHVLTQQAAHGSKSHEQEHFGHPKLGGLVPDSAIDMGKEHVPETQENTKGFSSFDGSAGFSSQGKKAVQTCQNMLELFHKVDQSRDSTAVSHRNPSSSLPEAESSDASVSHQWRNQSAASQGFGLRLAPPSQRLPVTNNAIFQQSSPQSANDLNSRQVDPRTGEKNQMWLSATSSVQSVPHEVSQRDHWDNNPAISGQLRNEASQSSIHANSSTTTTHVGKWATNQLQPSHMSSASRQVLRNQSPGASNDRFGSHFRQTNDIQNGVVADHSAHASLPRTISRTPPFNLSSPEDTSLATSTSMPSVKASSQHPILESIPVSHPSATVGRSQQNTYTTMLHNVWNNVSTHQHLAAGPHHKSHPNMFQSSNPSNSNLERTSFATQKLNSQDARQGGNGSEFGGSSIDSQQHGQQMLPEKVDPTPQKSGANLGHESLMKHLLATNPIASGSLMSHPHQHEVDRGRYGKEPVLVSQKDHLSNQNPASSNRDIEAYIRSSKLSQMSHPNYSLLHQVQAMKSMEADPNKRDGKRLKISESGSDAQQLVNKAGQQSFDGYPTFVRDRMDGDSNAAVRRSSFSPGDSKMLSFSSEGREEHNPNTSSQTLLGNVPSQDMVAFGQSDSLNRSTHHTTISDRSENIQVSPQMAPSWFDRNGPFNAGHMLQMYDARRTLNPVSQQFIYRNPSESLDTHTSTDQVNAVTANQTVQNTIIMAANEHVSPQSLSAEVTDQTLALLRPKKRKTEKLVLLPWHKEITHGSQRLQNISMAEREWAQAANRLVEKVAHESQYVEDEAEWAEDGQAIVRPRRRLILTTQLMQQLLRPAPAAILSSEASSFYESVLYFVAKLTLGEACSLISCSRNDSPSSIANGNTTANGNMVSGKTKNPERPSEQYFSKVVDDFIGRARKLESDLLRLDKRTSILDVRVECQDLEKCTIFNRFAKFHGGAQGYGAETSSTSSDAIANMHRSLPRRYITPRPMPRNLPEGVQCLSL